MKKFLMFIAAFILICIALASIGPMITLAIGGSLVYFSFKGFMKSPSVLEFLWWTIVGLIGLSILLSSIPALIGVAAIGILYYGNKELKKEKTVMSSEATFDYADFSNFEKEWDSVIGKK